MIDLETDKSLITSGTEARAARRELTQYEARNPQGVSPELISRHVLVLESRLPHKTVNLLFQLVLVNNKLTIVWGSRLSKTA